MNLKFLNKLSNSFAYAIAGIKTAVFSELNMRIHILAATLVLIAAYFFKISTIECCIVLICIGMVMGLELINTSIEKLCNFIHPQNNESIKHIKNISAGAVLVVSITSVIIALIIFIPKLLS